MELVAGTGMPRPRVNAIVCGLEVDFLWPCERVVVETDGAEHHASRAAFTRDRGRDARLVAAGYRVLRFDWRQVVERADEVLAALRAALERAGRERAA